MNETTLYKNYITISVKKEEYKRETILNIESRYISIKPMYKISHLANLFSLSSTNILKKLLSFIFILYDT